MKKPTLLPLMVLFTLFMVSCSSESIDDKVDAMATTPVTLEAKTIEIEILELINDYRISEGLSPLQNMNIIKSTAYSHTDYMIAQNNVSHDNFYQRKSYLINNAGANLVSENVAYGFTSATSVVNAWINSEGHRENIEGDYTNFDVSAEQNADGRWFYTNIFVKK